MFVKCFFQMLSPQKNRMEMGDPVPLDLKDTVVLGFPSFNQEGANAILSTCLFFTHLGNAFYLFLS